MRPKRNNPQLIPIRPDRRKRAQYSRTQRKNEGFHGNGLDLSCQSDKFEPMSCSNQSRLDRHPMIASISANPAATAKIQATTGALDVANNDAATPPNRRAKTPCTIRNPRVLFGNTSPSHCFSRTILRLKLHQLSAAWPTESPRRPPMRKQSRCRRESYPDTGRGAGHKVDRNSHL